MAVVKDNAYGHGVIPIAKHLEPKVDWFCVATVEEGIELRRSKITVPVLVFEAPREQLADKYVEFDLTASITDLSDFKVLKKGSQYQINFDTGMRRLGVPEQDIEVVYNKFLNYKDIICTGIYTHYASSDEPGKDSVPKQLNKFKAIKERFPNSLMAHTANTGAIFHYQNLDLQFDAVRAGVCLYGYAAGEINISDLQSIVEWNSKIMQVRSVKKGESVGYGEIWIAPEDGYVGTIPIGYGDGVQRILSGKITVKKGEVLIQQVGRISMDYFGIFSSTEILKKGATITLFDGDTLTPKEWAKLANTIPYEITTNLNTKIERSFIKK